MTTLPSTWIRPFGSTGLVGSAVTFGTSPLGDRGDRDAVAELLAAVLDSPIRTIDTSNGYSGGRSEVVIGEALAAHGGLPADALVITKTDADGRDYSGDRIRASVRESKQRLGLDELPLVHLHDPEFFDFDDITAAGGAVDALVALRDAGEIGRIGLAGGDARVMERYWDLGVFDALLVHNRLTLVDRSAEALVERAAGAGAAVFNAAILGGGLLAAPREGIDTYGYRPARPELLGAVSAMADLAEANGLDLATLALQASVRDERVSSTVVGLGRPERIASTVASLGVSVPDSVWAELERLRPPADVWLDA